jgi:hypothetical protein
MLYGQLSKDVWATALPLHWEKTQDMHKYLRRMVYAYTLEFGQAMFSVTEPRFQCTLIRWENHGGGNKRDVLLETSDPAQMEAVLLILISEAEIVEKANKLRSLK